MHTPRHDHGDSADLNAEQASILQADELETAVEPLHDGAGFEKEPRNRKRFVAPLALVAGLGVAVGGALALPSSDSHDVAEASTPAVSGHREHSVSRSSQRPSVTPTPAAASLTSTPSAKPSKTAKATPKATPTKQATPTKKVTPTKKATPSWTPAPTKKATPSWTPTPTKKATPSRTATPTKKATPSRTATPSKRATVRPLGEVTGSRYATTAVNVRSLPTTQARKLGLLEEGQKVSVTSVREDGWRQVKFNGEAGWVRSAYLVLQAPKTLTTASETTPAARPSSTATRPSRTVSSKPTAQSKQTVQPKTSTTRTASGTACKSSAVESGLTSNAIAVHRAVCANFPSITNFGGARGSADAHGSGRALDIMVSGDLGWQVARWARANASSLGITEVIYSQQIWTTQRSSEGWRSMSDRGSATANHYDHVHVTVR
ncbi:SH3 domain-containing protein [Luteococcus sp. OSA5]|uniref:SH3 domain-containing protein n=1 Tax=Luteococcus sp. OSA5 TaxID=3401630 RepID=UPI003B434E81